MSAPVIACLCVLALVIVCLLLVIRTLLVRVQVLTNGFARASVDTMKQARELMHETRRDTPDAVNAVLQSIAADRSRAAGEMLELVRTAWNPTTTGVDGADAKTPLAKQPYAGLETTYGVELATDDDDPTDALLSELSTGRHTPAAMIGGDVEDPDNPFGIEGLNVPRFGA